jgi:transcriptional regulator with XRE-family HTH domain
MAKKKTQIRHADIVARFAAQLRELRASRGLTQAELAERAKTTTSYVGRLESGAVAPGIDLLERLASALGTTSHELLPVDVAPDTNKMLRDRARDLFERLVDSADRETLVMLCPLLARLGESPTRRK